MLELLFPPDVSGDGDPAAVWTLTAQISHLGSEHHLPMSWPLTFLSDFSVPLRWCELWPWRSFWLAVGGYFKAAASPLLFIPVVSFCSFSRFSFWWNFNLMSASLFLLPGRLSSQPLCVVMKYWLLLRDVAVSRRVACFPVALLS